MLKRKLYIFEMANNHQGNFNLAVRIIDGVAKIKEKYKIDSAIKFQYRDLNTFIHPDYKGSKKIKYIKRFEETRLSIEEFHKLAEYARGKGLLVIATPFDESSVQLCINVDVDYIKIASCNMTDWGLLESASGAGKDLIISTGGHNLEDIDNVVSFFVHKEINISLLHCVSLYPANNDLNLNFIDKLKARFPDIDIGYSGHESPDNFHPVIIASSKGAVIFERHIGLENLNDYSMSVEENDSAEMWVNAVLATERLCGLDEKNVSKQESDSIGSLQRGVYAKREIEQGRIIGKQDVYYAIPKQDGQLSSGEMNQYRVEILATEDYKKDEAVFEDSEADDRILTFRKYMHRAKGMLNEAGISIGDAYEFEFSHHYGVKDFPHYGAILINMINREYCKKLMIQFPNQFHPEHMHKNKEETFQILWGTLTLKVQGNIHQLKKGDIFLIERHRVHSFSTITGVIFEEISTTSIKGDSYYTDTSIFESDPSERKTIMEKP